MRLWHKDLISVLPEMQLKGQWRECCGIASKLAKYGYPNHVLVNKIVNFPLDHFFCYTVLLVYKELDKIGLRPRDRSLEKFMNDIALAAGHTNFSLVSHQDLFQGWHSNRYLLQCVMNLEEKYDCGAISESDWFKIVAKVKNSDKYCKETYQSLFA